MCFEEAFGSKTVYCVVKCRVPDGRRQRRRRRCRNDVVLLGLGINLLFFSLSAKSWVRHYELPKRRGEPCGSFQKLRVDPGGGEAKGRLRDRFGTERLGFSHTRRIPLRRLSAGVCIVRAVFTIICLGGNLESAGDSSVTEKS